MNKRGFATVAIVLIGVVVLAVVGGVFYYESHLASQPSTSATAINSTTTSSGNSVTSQSWQTFKDNTLGFEFGYPGNWNIVISSTTNDEYLTLSPVAINQTAILSPSPSLSVSYLVTDNMLHSEFDFPPLNPYPVNLIQIDRYSGRLYITTSTVASQRESWFSETLGAYVKRGDRGSITLHFVRYSTSSNFSVADDTALFKSILATVKFGTKINGLTDAASVNNDKQKYDIFTFGLANDLLFYYADHKQFPDSLTALMHLINQPSVNVSTNTAFDNLGSRTMSHLNDFSYSVSPDHKSYQLGVSMQTTLVVDDGTASHFNSAAVGWANGFEATSIKPCRPSDSGIWCYDLVYSAQGAAPLSATSSPARNNSSNSASTATACDSICITSPEDGSTASPSSTLKVTVIASPTQSVSAMTLQTNIGSSAILTKPPYTFSLSIPANIQPGSYSIAAIARDSNQALIYSHQTIVNIGQR